MTNRRELADRLEDNADWLRGFPTRSIIDNKLSGVDGRGIDSVEAILREAARLLREPVAGEVLELLTLAREQAARGADKAGCDGWRAQEICRQIVPLLNKSLSILRARLDDEGKGGEA